MMGSIKYYRVNKADNRSEGIGDTWADQLGISLPFTSFTFTQEKIWLTRSDYKFHEVLQENAGKQRLSPSLEKLYKEVKEEDNPLIFIGYNKGS